MLVLRPLKYTFVIMIMDCRGHLLFYRRGLRVGSIHYCFVAQRFLSFNCIYIVLLFIFTRYV